MSDAGTVVGVDEQAGSSLSLIEVEPGLAVLFADQPPTDLDFVPFEMMADATRERLVDGLATATGVANLAMQGAQGVVNAQGLVRLAPQTVDLLKTFQPMTSGGWNLGPIVDHSGKIIAQARYLPATSAQAATVLTNLGPAAALLAVQMQLASISRRIDENIDLTRDVLRAIHEDQWMTLLGLHETTMRAVREAQAVGSVNDHVFAAIATKESDLRKQRHLFMSFVRKHAKALEDAPSDRRSYIQKNVDQIIADTHGMLMAEGSWYRAQVLRAGHIIRDDANSIENERLLATLAEESKREHAEAMGQAAGLLESLERQCRLMAELPGELSLPFSAKRRDIRETVAMAEALSDRVADLRGQLQSRRSLPAPSLTVFKEEAPEELLRILQWALPGEEPVLALADVNLDRLIGDNAYLGITSSSIFVSSQASVRKQGEIERIFPLADIRYVRFRERERQSPVLDIITVDENIRLTFDGWSTKGAGLDRARRLGNVLASAMQLPEEEIASDPLLSEAHIEGRAITA